MVKKEGIIMAAKKGNVIKAKKKTAVARTVIKKGTGKIKINHFKLPIFLIKKFICQF